MDLKREHVDFIDRLREASRRYGVVVDLLMILDGTVLIDDIGNREILDDEEGVEYLKAALMAAKFVIAERGILEDETDE